MPLMDKASVKPSTCCFHYHHYLAYTPNKTLLTGRQQPAIQHGQLDGVGDGHQRGRRPQVSLLPRLVRVVEPRGRPGAMLLPAGAGRVALQLALVVAGHDAGSEILKI